MIKRRFYKQDRGDKDEASDSSSSSSDSSADSIEEEEEVSSPREDENPIPSSPASGYESEDSSEKEFECDTSGLLSYDGSEDTGQVGENAKDDLLTGKDDEFAAKTHSTNVAKAKEFDLAEYADVVLKCKSVFKCRLCPRVLCLNEDSLMTHLKSKRHARSKKLLDEGRLKLMLNSDGEVEEEQETHAERHARILAVAQGASVTQEKEKKKNRGRQRQRERLKKKRAREAGDEEQKAKEVKANRKASMKSPKKRRKI